MIRGYRIWLLLAVLLAFGLRAVQLGERPLHTDESVNSFKFKQLWEHSGYAYDPAENHGPTLAYSTWLWNELTQMSDFARMSEVRLRSLSVLFGLALIVLLLLVTDAVGRAGVVAAAFLTAVSPMVVYYSRDYIHETLFVFFAFLALAAGWRHSQTGKVGWMVVVGAAIGLMQATKETFVFNLVAIGGALLLNEFLALKRAAGRPVSPTGSAPATFTTGQLIAAGVAWLVVASLLFTSFFAHPAGLLDAAGTYLFWVKRAAGQSPHIHPWSFYWQRLLFFHDKGPVWSEALIFVLAIGGGVAAFSRRELPGADRGFVRLLAFYTGILALIYTVLPYKTPWLALDFWQPAIVLAGLGAATLLAWLPGRGLKIGGGIVLLTGTAQLAFQSWQSDVNYAADPCNPWVYAQTSPNLLELVDKVDQIALASPAGRQVTISLIAPNDDYWPLPWYLRRYGNVGVFINVPGYAKFDADEIQDLDSFLNKVETYDAPIFSAEDILDLPSLAKKLSEKSDPVSLYLRNHLSKAGEDAIAAYTEKSDQEKLKAVLAAELNQIVGGPPLFDSERFHNVHLQSGTEALVKQNPTGPELRRLNRLLLENAYPLELWMNPASVSKFLLQSGLTNHLAGANTNQSEAILVTNMNQIISGPGIYDSNRFQDIRLRLTTEVLLRENPTGPDLVRLNRRLLEDAYTKQLGTNNLPVEPYSSISIISTKLDQDVDPKKAGVPAGLFEHRPNVFLDLYVQTNIWADYLQRKTN